MSVDQAVVDGPNIFNRIGALLVRSLDARLHDLIKPYLLEWFDIDLMLAAHLNSQAISTKIVHSHRALGRDSYRLTPDETRKFWRRQAALAGCHDRTIDIPGEDVEAHDGQCPECRRHVEVRSSREKGVDVAVAVELLAIPLGTAVALVSTDTDLSPAVEALARTHHVICVGTTSSEPTALHIRAAAFVELEPQWFRADFGTFLVARVGGALDAVAKILGDAGHVFAIQWFDDSMLRLLNGTHRAQLGVAHTTAAHAELEALVDPLVVLPELAGVLGRAASRHRVTVWDVIPVGFDVAVDRRRRSRAMAARPAWVEAERPHGVFSLLPPE